MTAPIPDSLGMRHVRTVAGLTLMILSVALVGYEFFLDGKAAQACVTSWVEFAHDYVFPALLFLSGLLLFSREAFGDLLTAGKTFIPGAKA